MGSEMCIRDRSIGHISGCNINPAVTIGLVTGRKMGIVKGALYIIAQCIGALIGAGILQVKGKVTAKFKHSYFLIY